MRSGQPCAVEVTIVLQRWRVNIVRLGNRSGTIRSSRATNGRYTMNSAYVRARVYVARAMAAIYGFGIHTQQIV